jgi:hypothetical protein
MLPSRQELKRKTLKIILEARAEELIESIYGLCKKRNRHRSTANDFDWGFRIKKNRTIAGKIYKQIFANVSH